MSKIIILIFCVLLCGNAFAQNTGMSDIQLDLIQANRPKGIDQNGGYNVIQGKQSSATVAPDANTSGVLQPLRNITVDPNVGGYNVTGPDDCGARCLGNRKRVYGASEVQKLAPRFGSAPLVKPENSLID